MLSWLFKKRGTAAAPAATPAPAHAGKPATARPKAAGATATAAPAPAPAPTVDEGPLLRAALGDDAALLRLAQSAQALATKLAAVEALVDEAALRQAERAFRSHDRKVHRLAKQRLEAAVTRREAHAQALALLERTRGLMGEALVPVNHLVEIDRAWAALPAQALAPDLQQAHTTLRAELDARMQAQDEALRRLQRWTAEARLGLESATRALGATAEGGSAQDAAQLAEAVAALRATRPDAAATAALDAALAQAQQAATQLQAELEQRAAVAPAADPEPPAAQPATTTVADAAANTLRDEARRAAQRQRLEGMVQQAEAALAEGQLGVLQQRLQAIENTLAHATVPEALRARLLALQAERGRLKAWQQWGGARARDDLVAEAEALARQTLAAEPPEARRARDAAAEVEAAAAAEHAGAAGRMPAVEAGEAGEASEAGAPGALGEPVETTAPHASPGSSPPATVQTGASAEANEVAAPAAASEIAAPAEPAEGGAITAPSAATDAPATPQPPMATTTATATPAKAARAAKTPRPPPPVKLNLKQHADSIQSLRRRWKALDHQGAVASAAQWQRFDAALTLAHEPVAAQQAALKAARQDNLAAREALLAALESGPAAQAAAQAAQTSAGDAPAPAEGDSVTATPPDWRACIAELDRFQSAWRKLGPVEHTVPSAARDALLQRLQATLARVEAPLQQARATAAAEREALIAQADRLLPAAGGRPASDSTRQVRELQAAWQEHARRLPLPRGLETALWARFKAATDAVFTQREAAHAARDAELAANLAAAQALVDRLAALEATTPPADIQRTLAEVDRAWRLGGEVPRGAIDGLEARYGAARSAAAGLLNAGQQQRWQARCDALAARLALCEAREDGSTDTATLETRWAEPATLPAPWQQALAQRWAQAGATGPLPAAEVDELLLRLEAALNLPTAPAWQAARQQLKLRALKDTMEGRTPVQAGPQQNAGWLQALLRQAGLDAAQRVRLRALLAALRAGEPSLLGLPAEKA